MTCSLPSLLCNYIIKPVNDLCSQILVERLIYIQNIAYYSIRLPSSLDSSTEADISYCDSDV